jgi:hypothetical protein
MSDLDAHETYRKQLQCARSGGSLAFQHQRECRRVAAGAVGRAAKQLLHVSNRATGRSHDRENACAVAARASHHHFDGVRRNCGAGTAGGCTGGQRLHSPSIISSAAKAADCRAQNAASRRMVGLGANV